MPVALKSEKWSTGIYDSATGEHLEVDASICLKLPMSAFVDGYISFFARPYDAPGETHVNALIVFASLPDGTFTEPEMRGDTTEPVVFLPEQTRQWVDVYFSVIDMALAPGQTPSQYAAEYVSLDISPYFFTKSSLGIYITPQQMMQFENMYPDCFRDAYRNAVGELTAEVGNRFDMAAMLGEADEDRKDDTMRWILQVMTAYNIASPSLNYSEPLDAAYKKVAQTIIKLKGGMVSLEEPTAYRNDKYDANAEVIVNRYRYRG